MLEKFSTKKTILIIAYVVVSLILMPKKQEKQINQAVSN